MKKAVFFFSVLFLLFPLYQRYLAESAYSGVIFCVEKDELKDLSDAEDIVPIVTPDEYVPGEHCIMAFNNAEDFLKHRNLLLEDLSVIAFYFTDECILGNVNKDSFKDAVNSLPGNIAFLSAEFSGQKDLLGVEKYFKYRLSRIHGLKKKEYSKINRNFLYSRFLRAYRERNIRFLKLAVIDRDSQEYISRLKEALADRIFQKPDIIVSELISYNGVLVSAASALLFFSVVWSYLSVLKSRAVYIVFFTVLLLSFSMYFSGYASGSESQAFFYAVIYPVFSSVFMVNRVKHAEYMPVLCGLAGGFSVAALLSDYEHMLAIESFVGVKAALIIPIVFCAVYTAIKLKLKTSDIPRIQYVIGAAAAAAILYILRSGNWARFLITDYEIFFRNWLEKIMIMRPRFKEFAVGYPALALYLGYHQSAGAFFNYVLLILITVIPITIINTFCHIHTPLLYSLLRTCNGIWTGGIMAAFAVFLVKPFLRSVKEESV